MSALFEQIRSAFFEGRDMKFRYITVMLASTLVMASSVVAEDGSFDSNGVKIYYVTEGNGEPVVLIHGFMADHDMWGKGRFLNSVLETKVMATLAKDYRVIALDCRGHGKSGKPSQTESYGPAMAEDVVRLLDHLKIPKAHLVGYSMGSLIAGRVAAMHPERVLSVTFGGGAAIIPIEAKAQEAFAKGIEDGTALIPLVIGLSPADQPKPTRQEAEAIVNKLLSAEARSGLAAALRSFENIIVTPEELKKCKAPVLYVHGANEYPHIKARVPVELKLLGRGELKVVDGGDHLSTPGQPEFLAAVLEFLRANKQ
jgi:pimeloyl-ACP methyl ester carboxylesterase